jgi:formate--tetrahydrofolate ligase
VTSKVPTDIAIAQAARLRPIADIAAEAGLEAEEFLPYGRYKAKITAEAAAKRPPKGRLVLVTGPNQTPAGEGKSTVTVGVPRRSAASGTRRWSVSASRRLGRCSG